MKAPIMAAAVFAALTGSAFADVHYDRKLEAAVLSIVAGRIGDLRGPLAYNARVVRPEGVDTMTTSSVGVAPVAVEAVRRPDPRVAANGSVVRIPAR